MGLTDRRDKTKTYEKGSSLLFFFLTQAQKEEAWAQLAAPAGGWTDGWEGIGFLVGGDLGPDRDTEIDLDEAGERIKEVVNRDEFVIGNAARQTDDYTLHLLEWLESNEVPARYALPAGEADFSELGDGSDVREVHQVWAFNAAGVDTENYRIATTGKRTRPFTLRAIKKGANPVKVGPLTVDLADQTGWPAALAFAKDTPE